MVRTKHYSLCLGLAALSLWAANGLAAVTENPSPPEVTQPAEVLPVVPPPARGVYTEKKRGASGFRLTVKGRNFTSRGEIERYLAYRAAELAMARKSNWFTLTEARQKGDTVAVLKRDPTEKRYSFRMQNWRPVWRYKLAGERGWKIWSPFSGASFFAEGRDPKAISEFEVTVEVILHKGPMDSADPLAFEAGAVSDFLVNQVSPPT